MVVSPSAREALAQLAARHRRACARGHPRPAQRIVWTVGCAAGRSQCLAQTAGSDSGPPTPATTRPLAQLCKATDQTRLN